jgi:hypothetical protein
VSLDHRYDGLVVAWIDRAPDADLDALERWLLDEGLPSVVAEGTSIGQALIFSPRDFPVCRTPASGCEKLLVAFFLSATRARCLGRGLRRLRRRGREGGLGTVGLAAPFVPGLQPGAGLPRRALVAGGEGLGNGGLVAGGEDRAW